MADYYPLLNRAIAGLADRPDADRHAIYGRARDALERQLRGFEPALEEEAIRLELDALEATIARIEAERAAPATPEPPPSITGPSPYKAVRPTVDDLPPKAEMTDDPSYTPPGTVKPDMAMMPAPPEPESPALQDAPEPEAAPTVETSPLPSEAPAEINSPVGDLAEDPPAIQPMLRPRMPSRREGDSAGSRKPLALFAGVAIAAMMVMGLVAVTHKNKPDRPVGPPVIAAPDSTQDASKTEGRLASSDAPAKPPEAKDVAQASPPPAKPDASKTTPPTQETRPPTPPPATVSNTNRAFMVLEVAGASPNQFEGKTTWTYGPDPALKGQKSLRAAIDFPAGALSVDFSIAPNTDAGINASHTVMVIFDAKSLDNVREMSAVEWRERESQMGTVLAGIVVPVQDNVFMIGLDKTEAALKRNLDLLRSQKWMVFEFRLANGRRGAILVEKGASGEKAIGDALTDWK